MVVEEYLDIDDIVAPSNGAEVGTLITREMMMDELEDHPLEVLSRDARVFIHDFAMEMHKGMKAKTGGPPARHHHRLWGGPKGYGKSAGANNDAFTYFILGGDVFSTSGPLFGYRVAKEKFYTFSSTMPQKAWMLVDEVHMYVDSHGQALRNQVVEENDALLRKKSARMDATSTKSHRLPGKYLEEVDCVFFPTPFTPRRVREGDTNWGLPPFCYVYLDCVGPRPYAPKDLRDDWKITPKWEKTRRMRKIIPPLQIYISMHMYDSWVAPDLGSGFMTSGQDIKDAISDEVAEGNDREKAISFRKAVNFAVIEGWDLSGRSLEPLEVFGVSRQYGSIMEEKEVRRYLKMSGVWNSANRVVTDNFIEKFLTEEVREIIEV